MEKRKGMKKKDAKDSRFDVIKSDPKFDVLPTKKKKVVIDERFKGMLSNKNFSCRGIVDMRGRMVDLNSENSLKDLYELENDQSSSSEDLHSEDEKEIKIDLARGDGNISSSDNDSDEEWDLADEDVKEHCWGELDRDARRVEWASRRLALCNMEWDRITAKDIYVLFSSFKPSFSEIISVTIYLSDFGKERLQEEEKTGPKLGNFSKLIEEGAEMDNKTREALRAYQLDRMRYYYAIVECDSDKTASSIYESCDGVEFESSAIRMDLRFVPDEMTFEEIMVKDRATEDTVNINNFKPKIFESSALSKSSSKLTWDETDPERIKTLREAFNRDADLDRFQSLIAPASSDEEETYVKSKAKILLESVESQVAKPKNKDDLEITWEPGGQLGNIKIGEESKMKVTTPWEKFIEKRRAKRRERKVHKAEIRRRKKIDSESISDLPTTTLVKEEHDIHLENQEIKIQQDDERFAALYSNSAFAIDQSSPLFKSTSLVMKQVSEKQKLRRLETKESSPSYLVEKLKKKTKNRNESKNSVAKK